MEHKLINELRTLIESCGQDEAKLMNDLSILVKQRESKNDAPMVEAPRPLSEVHQAYMDECSTKENTSKIVYTGYTYLDAQFPLLKGEVVVVGARPGMGKTAFLVNLAWGIAAKMPVLYCNYSINARSLANRFIGFLAGIRPTVLDLGELDEVEKERVIDAADLLKQRNILIQDGLHADFDDFLAECRSVVADKGVQVIVIDDIQQFCNAKFAHGREALVRRRLYALKKMARQLDVCLLIASQVNRSAEARGGDRKPYLFDLRESGAIEEVADKVFFVYRAEYYDIMEDMYGNSTFGLMEVIVASNKKGVRGELFFVADLAIGEVKESDSPQTNFKISNERLSEFPF